jgi:hypothetical protein
VEREADVRPGGGKLSRIAPIVIHFGVFARGKPCAGMAGVKSSLKVNPCSASAAVCLEMQQADDDFPDFRPINSDRLQVRLCAATLSAEPAMSQGNPMPAEASKIAKHTPGVLYPVCPSSR